MNPIHPQFAALQDAALPSRQITELMAFTQTDAFFQLAVAKTVRLVQLKQHFQERAPNRVFLSANLAGLQCELKGYEVNSLEKDYFQETDAFLREQKMRQLEGAVVIINNNDLAKPEARVGYLRFYEECLHTCFVVWDWDNHHWLDLSTFAAAHCDVYAPAHHENLYLLTRYNWLTAGPVYCSTVQWSRKLLTESLSDMLIAQRSDQPLGMHIPYVQFKFRMQVISTLNQRYPGVGFSSPGFHVRTAEDRLKEWYSHQMHWIAPVLNDVPIRIFDALITGGIPIVPSSMQLLQPVSQIPRNHIVFYSPTDIVNPETVVFAAKEKFELSGSDGIAERHRYALEHHHGHVSVLVMLGFVAEALEHRL